MVTDGYPSPVVSRYTSAQYPLRMDIRNDLKETNTKGGKFE